MKRINDEALLERIGFNPHKGQIPIIEAIKDPTKRDFVLVCGKDLFPYLYLLIFLLESIKQIGIYSYNQHLI